MSEDVLETYNRKMAEDHAIFRYDASGEWLETFEALAAEVRALRAERSDTMSYFLDPNDPGSPPKYTDDYGPTLLNQIQGLAGYYEEMMDKDRAEVLTLREMLAFEKAKRDQFVAEALKITTEQDAEVQALRAERNEIERKAIEQSEYIQSHGLTDFEMARLKARVKELEAKIEAARKGGDHEKDA